MGPQILPKLSNRSIESTIDDCRREQSATPLAATNRQSKSLRGLLVPQRAYLVVRTDHILRLPPQDVLDILR